MALPSDILGEVAGVSAASDVTAASVQGANLLNSDTRRIQEKARRIEALSMKLAGFSYEQISDRLEITESSVKDLISRTLSRAESQGATGLREIENARLDRAQAAVWTKVLEGDLHAVDVFLRISARRAKMNGFDAPTQINLSVNVKQEMEQALAALESVVLGEVIVIGTAEASNG
jgi:DNA-binding CsgD family transcriptional regulator